MADNWCVWISSYRWQSTRSLDQDGCLADAREDLCIRNCLCINSEKSHALFLGCSNGLKIWYVTSNKYFRDQRLYYNLSAVIVSVTSGPRHIWAISDKNTHICERNTIVIDEREKLQDFFFDTLSFYSQNSQERKQGSSGDL